MLNKKILTFLVFILNLYTAVVFAAQVAVDSADYEINKSPMLLAASQQLVVERARRSLLARRLDALNKDEKRLKSVTIDNNILQRATLAVSLAQTDLDGITLALQAAQKAVSLTESTIRTLDNQQQTIFTLNNFNKTLQENITKQLEQQRALLNLQLARVKILQQTQDLAHQTLLVAQDYKNQLQAKFHWQQQMVRQHALEQLAANLQREQADWLRRLSRLEKQLHAKNISGWEKEASYERLEIDVFEAEERSNLSQIELDLAKLHNRVDDLTFAPEQNTSLAALNANQRQIDFLAQQLKDIHTILQSKISLLQQRIDITTKGLQQGSLPSTESRASLKLSNDLLKRYQQQLNTAESINTQINNYQDYIAQQLKLQLAYRQGLPGFDVKAWLMFGKKLMQIPVLTWQSFQSLSKPIWSEIYTADVWDWSLWLVLLISWGALWHKLRRVLKIGLIRFEKRSHGLFAVKTLLISLQLLRRHLSALMLISGFIGLLALMNIPLKTFSLFFSIAFALLGFSLLIVLARLLLLEGVAIKNGDDVKLYYRLKWALLTGGIVTTLAILVHQLPVPYDVQDLFGRLFMLFLLVVALVLLKSWRVVPTLLEPYLERQRHYIRQIVRWLSLLIPISVLINALIGLIGYIELAWSMAAYQGIFLIVVTGYILCRGLLDELMRLIAEQFIRKLRNGWLWSEALLKPLHQVLKLMLLVGTFALLFNLYGWGQQSVVVAKLSAFASFHLFNIGSTDITLLTILQLVLVILILIWTARWTREFSYRWLFARTNDLGLRNSLAIFTQYSLVLLGIIIGLKVLGIDLTALAYIFSAFAVALGFGLRDLANNFASGFLLLIERPVKVGDLITVGSYEGYVVHIGARSITINTPDHQELLIPNAEIFSKPFINWTHHDTVVRTVIMLKVSRKDDPYKVKQIILDVLKSVPRIINNPPPDVYFKEIENMLLEFKVEYYIDIRNGDVRSSTRSKVLFALWDKFQVEGIHPPDYPHEILLHADSNS